MGPTRETLGLNKNISTENNFSCKKRKKSSILRNKIMSTIRLKNQFVWEQEIPEIRGKGDIFRNRSFAIFVRQGRMIKLLLSFTHDLPKEINLKAKVVQGAEMMPGLVKGVVELELKYNLEGITGAWKIKNLDSVHKTTSTDRLIFCNEHRGRKITFSLSTVFDVLRIEEDPMLYKCLKLHELIYFKKELSDIKLICESKIFECHKLVLSCQSEVFQAMFKCKSTVESESGEVEIEDFKAKTVEKMVYFVYHDNLMSKENVDSDLLLLAEKYNVRGLINYCVKFLEENLSLENVLDVLVSSHLTNQKRLFNAAAQFTIENRGLLVKTEKWKEVLENNTKLASKIMATMLQLE